MIWISARQCLTEWLSDRVTDMLLVDASVMMITGSINILYKVYNTAGIMNYDEPWCCLLSDWMTDRHACRRWFYYDMMDLGLLLTRKTKWDIDCDGEWYLEPRNCLTHVTISINYDVECSFWAQKLILNYYTVYSISEYTKTTCSRFCRV